MKYLQSVFAVVLSLWLSAAATGQSSQRLRAGYAPAWRTAPAARVLDLTYDTGLSNEGNGERLRLAVLALTAGDHLRISAGRWSVNSFFYAYLRGTASAPIRITGEPGTVITRPNAGQNVINLGGDGAAPLAYVLLRGIEVEGGSYGIRVHEAEDLWIDQCHVHHTGAVAIGANTHDTRRLHVTRCEIHDTSQTGEGLYIGANGGTVVASDAVIALNHIHHTHGYQGDGIELKQGSYGCLIAENTIHDTLYPGILCYGTGGGPVNRIQGNTIWNTGANPFQVQGEAVVTGNLVFARNGPALQTAPHQGLPTRLSIVGNTFIAENGRAATISAWGGQERMVLRNNVFYSRSDVSVAVNGGLDGVDVGNNVVLGSLFGVPGGAGFLPGGGTGDMIDVAWDGSRRDARPLPGGPLYLSGARVQGPSEVGLTGAVRPAVPSVGALELGTYGRYVGAVSPGAPRLRLRAPLDPSGAADTVLEVEGLERGDRVVLGITAADSQAPRAGLGPLPIDISLRRVGIADKDGRLRLVLPPSALGGLQSARVALRAQVFRGSAPGVSSRSLVLNL